METLYDPSVRDDEAEAAEARAQLPPVGPSQTNFEAWCVLTAREGRRYPFSAARNNLDSTYVFYVTQYAWEGWQAANARTLGFIEAIKEKIHGKDGAERMCKVLDLIGETLR